MLFEDARDYQILFIASFLTLDIATKDWTFKPELVATIIVTCLIS